MVYPAPRPMTAGTSASPSVTLKVVDSLIMDLHKSANIVYLFILTNGAVDPKV